jgi:hypothetical protein
MEGSWGGGIIFRADEGREGEGKRRGRMGKERVWIEKE